ncbi:MAG: Cys/Met metabolism pyridoxal-phosphate-dependent protein [Spirochaetales bacterium]|nr:MAG: Cys/Met metabolism pyridoxal-phosphate-dependent protein [Spirochaetales bacterium]
MNQLDSQRLSLTHLADDYEQYLGAVVPPVFLNTLHVYSSFQDYVDAGINKDTKFVYGRLGNPTTVILEKKLAAMEHGSRAVCFSSGMAAAAAAITAVCRSGDHIICMRDVYQPVKRILNTHFASLYNIDVSYVSGLDLEEIERAVRPETRLMILESPATFVFTVVDLKAIAEICKKHGIISYIDNTYSTPLFQNPLDLGIDICMHTLSKYISGHSDVIGGVLISSNMQLIDRLVNDIRELYGAILGPMESWLVIRGLRSLEARVRRHQEITLKVARFLENHPKVKRVMYTGLESHPQSELIAKQMSGHTGLLSLELKGKPENGVAFIDNLKLFGKGCSWGGYESLALCPLYYIGQQEMDFLQLDNKGLVRLHCGLEGENNLIADLSSALDKI